MAKLRQYSHLLRNIVTFETASRSENFTKAADELGVTRVAVSRQIADLETAIGHKLFVRNHRSVALTGAGKAFAELVNPALHRIGEAFERQRREQISDRLSVTVTSAFATYWLMPKLIDFSARYPDIEVNLVVSDRYLNIEAEQIDVAIRYSPEPPTGDLWQPLIRESIFPVFSGDYAARTTLSKAEDLQHERLLYLSGRYRAEARWEHWFSTQGLTAPEERTGVQVNTYNNMLQAAIQGQGIALAGHPLVDAFLENGSLRVLQGIEPLVRDFYYLYCAPERKDASLFCDWLKCQ